MSASSTSNNTLDVANEEKELTYYGSAKSKVVGVQYYKGIVSKRERLILEREPNNIYDKNAIVVKNSNGDKIGHIPREVAAFVSPFIDSDDMDVEAITGTTAPGTYTLAIVLHIFVSEQCKKSDRFRNINYCLPNTSKDPAYEENGNAVGGNRLTRENFSSDYSDIFSRLTAGAEGDPYAGIDFENPLHRPTEAFVGKLLPYQQQGVAWMRFHEEPRSVDFSHIISGEVGGLTRKKSSVKISSDSYEKNSVSVAPKRTRSGTALTKSQENALAIAEVERKEREATSWFWKENPSTGEYTNVLTNFTTKTKPIMPRGGLLGDAMGLGKTVQMLAVISHKISKSSTLIVCPLSLLNHWEEHIKEFLPSFTSAVYHGGGRSATMIKNADVVITTYTTLATESKSGALQSTSWGRVILDEAHAIKSAKTQAAKACSALTATCRWCVTGTPLQNSLSDLQSLIAFLHVEPFSDAKWWQQLLIRPMRSRDPRGLERLRCLLRVIVLRRTKETKGADGNEILTLPPIKIEEKIIPMSVEEKSLYKKLKDITKLRIESLEKGKAKCTAAGTSSNIAYAEALVLLLRLRQLCNHPTLIPATILSSLKASETDSSEGLMQKLNEVSEETLTMFAEMLLIAADETCSICLEPITNAAVTTCRHLFCYPCISTYAQTISEKPSSTQASCPNCRSGLKIAMKHDDPRLSEKNTSPSQIGNTTSSKVDAVATIINEQIAKGKREDGSPTKIVVFSQWPSMLAVLNEHLSKHTNGVKSVTLTGSMSSDQRQASIKAFSQDDTVRVIFLSTMAGSVGLNLVSASACVLVDPWWNPSIDQQAIMRVHRIGQECPVTVYRLAMEDSVELSIWDLQRKKQALFDGAFGGENNDIANSRKTGLSFDELRQFFK